MSAFPCPGRGELTDWSVGRLTELRQVPIAEHVNECAECLNILHSLETVTDQLLDDLRRPAAADALTDEAGYHRAIEAYLSIGSGNETLADERGRFTFPSTTPAVDPLLGTRLGPYELLEQLGRGGMGAVYRARHTLLLREVALKILPAERLGESQAVGRFRREMMSVGALDHPNIVQARDAGEASGIHYLAMELVKGLDLSQVVKRWGPLSVADACAIIHQAAEALDHVHRHGLVHRDIKPSNLMLAEGGRVKLLDLGLALLSEPQPGADELTQTGQVMGTATYIAPEQVADPRSVDIRADLYSLGCTLYCLLAGHPPFSGPQYRDSVQLLYAHQRAKPASVRSERPDVPESLARIVARLLSKNPAERHTAPAELVVALEPFCAGHHLETLLDTPEPSHSAITEIRPKPSRISSMTRTVVDHALAVVASTPRRRQFAGAAAVVAFIAAVGVVWNLSSTRRDRKGGEGEGTAAHRSTPEIVAPATPGGAPLAVASNSARTTAPPVVAPGPAPPPTSSPLSALALVRQPYPIAGVRGWTIETRAQRGQINGGGALAYAPDGKTVACSGVDATIRFFDSDSGRLLRALVGHSAAVQHLAFSPDGKLLASGSLDDSVRIWETASGRMVQVIRGHVGGVLSVAFSPDGKTLASGGSDRTVSLWDARSWQLVASFSLAEPVGALAWSPDGKQLACDGGKAGERLSIWDVEAEKPTLTLRDHVTENRITLSWSPWGGILASADNSLLNNKGHINLWDSRSGSWLKSLDSPACRGVAWSPDGRRLASSGGEIWEPTSDRMVQSFAKRWGFDEQGVGPFCGAVAWSPDGRRVVFASGVGGGSFDVDSGKEVFAIDSHEFMAPLASAPAFSPTGDRILTVDSFGTATIWETSTGKVLHHLDGNTNTEGLSWSPDGKQVTMISINVLRVLDAEAPGRAREISMGNDRFHAVVWSSDSSLIAVSTDRDIQVWDVVSLKRRQVIDAPQTIRLAFSADGEKIITSGLMIPARIWQVNSGKLLHEVAREPTTPWGKLAAGWSPDGKVLATGNGSTIRLWDATTFAAIRALEQSDTVTDLAWSRDSKVLAAAGAQAAFSSWDPAAGRLLRTTNLPLSLRQLERAVWPGDGWAFSPDLRYVAGSGPCMTQIVDLKSATTVLTQVILSNRKTLGINPEGHYRGTPRIERELIYIVETAQGQETLTPDEFSAKFGWTNDPDRVRLAR